MLWERIAEALGIRKEEVTPRDVLEALGIHLVGDERVEARLALLEEFYRCRNQVVALKQAVETGDITPEKALRDALDQLNELNKSIDSVAIPFLRALDNREAAVMVKAWSEVNGYFFDVGYTLLNWFERVNAVEVELKKTLAEKSREARETLGKLRERLVSRPRLPKSVLVSTYLSLIIREYLPRAETLVRISWSSADVKPSWLGAIQTVVQAVTAPPTPVEDLGSPAELEEVPKKVKRRGSTQR